MGRCQCPQSREANAHALALSAARLSSMKSSLVVRRTSLIVQAADALRRELRQRRWVDVLPSERSLCRLLHISRSSLRDALMIVERDGLIKISHGRKTRILRAAGHRNLRGAERKVVGALMPESLMAGAKTNLLQFADLQQSLQNAGLTLEAHFNLHFSQPGAGRALETLVRDSQACCWLLFSPGRTVQHWFMTHSIPCLVDGFAYEGIRLPSIDVDHAASARHAVGKFLAAGHRRLVYLGGTQRAAGLLASEQGFSDALRSCRHADAASWIVHHDGTVGRIQNVIRAVLHSGSPWTGMLIFDARSALAAVGCLRRLGAPVPERMAVISQNHDEFLELHEPTIASYDFDNDLYINRLSRLAITLALDGFLPAEATRLMTRFRPGDSFVPAQLPSSPNWCDK